MKKSLFVVLLIFLVISLSACSKEEYIGDDPDKIVIYYFSGPGCPSCDVQSEFMNTLPGKYSDIEIVTFDVSVEGNDLLLERLAQAFDERIITPPVTFIAEESVVGFNTAQSTGLLIEDIIQRCQRQSCRNPSVVLREFEER